MAAPSKPKNAPKDILPRMFRFSIETAGKENATGATAASPWNQRGRANSAMAARITIRVRPPASWIHLPSARPRTATTIKPLIITAPLITVIHLLSAIQAPDGPKAAARLSTSWDVIIESDKTVLAQTFQATRNPAPSPK